MDKYVIGNLKMNLLTQAERDHYLKSFIDEVYKAGKFKSRLIICPPSFHLEKFIDFFRGKKVSVGAQNIYFEQRGSFTGEISALMIKSFGAEWVIVGHSERRRLFGETDEVCNLKLRAALEEKIKPILCVGENLDQRKNDLTFEVVSRQIESALKEVVSTQIDKLIIAYEPIWSVGSDEIPSSDEVMQVKILIRKKISELYSPVLAEKVPILYGGSVKPKNVKQLCLEAGMDGVLVGRESLVPGEFLKIVQSIDKN